MEGMRGREKGRMDKRPLSTVIGITCAKWSELALRTCLSLFASLRSFAIARGESYTLPFVFFWSCKATCHLHQQDKQEGWRMEGREDKG